MNKDTMGDVSAECAVLPHKDSNLASPTNPSEIRLIKDIKFLACAVLGITPDSHTQSKEEYDATEKRILDVARHYLQPENYPAPEREQGEMLVDDMAEEIAAIRRLHAKSPHILDYRMEDGFTIPVLNVLIALANRQPVREAVSLAPIREALEAAPVYATNDGTWLNFRPNAAKRHGGAMIRVEGDEAEAIRAFGKKVETALDLLNSIEGGKSND